MSLWNHSHEAAEGLIRTTNAVEIWHLGVTALFQGSHPSLYIFLNKIQMDSSDQKFNVLKAMGGTQYQGQIKYRDIHEKIQNVSSNFNKDHVVDYLYALAHLTFS